MYKLVIKSRGHLLIHISGDTHRLDEDSISLLSQLGLPGHSNSVFDRLQLWSRRHLRVMSINRGVGEDEVDGLLFNIYPAYSQVPISILEKFMKF